MKGTGPDRDRTQRTPGPWVAVQDPLDTTWRILHRMEDNNILVAIVADEGDAKLICDAVNTRNV